MTTGAAAPSVLRSSDFRFMLSGRAASTAATAVTWVLLPLHVYDITGSATAAASMSAMNVVPFLLFGLFAGAYVDRLRPRTVMVVVEVVSALVLLLVPAVVLLSEPPFVVFLVIGFLASSAFVWFDVASSALVPAVAGPERIFQANGHLWMAATVVNAVAAPAGFFLLERIGLAGAFLVIAGAYVVSAVLTSFLRAGRSAADGAEGREGNRVGWSEILEGLRFIRSDRVVGVLTLAGAGIGISGGAVYSTIVVFSDLSLDLRTDDIRVGWIIAGCSVGALIAAVLTPRLRSLDPVLVSAVTLAVDVVLLVAYAWSPGWVVALILLAGWNTAHTIAMIVSISVRQQRCPAHLQGRVNAVGRMAAWGAVPLGGGLCGVLIDLTGQAPVALTIMVLPSLAAFGFVLSVVFVRRAESPDVSKENA
ncbi:MFS transporter [Nocardiopsis valliformis]|uniref:MFS transporter n=1 Tax=Nocardiopsis valliformis TaxID=239974 RepID=UPI00034DE4F1|nr:MFS transporter [Nocardiopsis valliformis]